MTDVAIRVDGLGKAYRISHRPRHRALRDVIADAAAAPLRHVRGRGAAAPDTLWALRAVSFDVPHGQVLGVIGRNGAGKSTLLKILSRIVDPTEGRAEIRGRVGSLLEVGTGFHSELTGRENVYLNGAILGMGKEEIDRKFDEIVAFAETERFIDTPVKHYSSGMHMRLAFAVAAHLDTQVLLVDEVLAVGDAAFQRKCIGKMGSVARDGRTIFFVSHQMDAIERLCSRCLLFEGGRLVGDGPSAAIVARYLSSISSQARAGGWIDLAAAQRLGTGAARFTAVRYTSDLASVDYQPYTSGPLEVALAIESDAARSVGSLAVTIYNQLGTKLVNADTLALQQSVTLRPGENQVVVRIERLYLTPGVYRLGLWLADPLAARHASGAFDYLESAFEIEVLAGPFGTRAGSGVVACDFTVTEAPSPAAR